MLSLGRRTETTTRQTTLTKAKALRPFIEKVITKAKRAAAVPQQNGKTAAQAIHLRRLVLSDVRNEDAVTKLFNETYKEFANRNGGYTRIYKLGPQRQSRKSKRRKRKPRQRPRRKSSVTRNSASWMSCRC